MSDPVLVALVGAAAAILTGLLTLLGQRYNQRSQQQLADNAEKLRRYEEWEHLLNNYRQDSDRLRAELAAERLAKDAAIKDRDEALRRARNAERQVDEWINRTT